MNKVAIYILIALSCLTLPVMAQDTLVEEMTDTVEMTTSVVAPDEMNRFDKVDPASISYSTRKADTALLKKIRADKSFAYAVKAPAKKKTENQGDSWLNKLSRKGWFKTVLWILVILSFLAILIAFLTRSNISLFRKESKTLAPSEEPDESPRSIFDINYEKEIPAAIGKGNYHLAVRLLYLQLLKTMADRHLIDYRQERTNGDYLFQLFNKPYYKDFFSITRNYEYVWYGKFPVTEQAFETMHAEFEKFQGRLPV